MEEYYGSADGSGDGSYSIDASSANHIRRRLLPRQFSANAYLGHAFNACASTSPESSGSAYVDVDPSLLRYTRPRLSSSSSSSNEWFWQFFHLQSPLGSSSSSSSPSPMGRAACTPTRRPSTVYCTPGRGAVMDEVLVINDERHEHNRVSSASARRRLDLGSHSASSAYGGSIQFRSGNTQSGGGSGVFHPLPPDLGCYSPTFRSGGGRGVFHPLPPDLGSYSPTFRSGGGSSSPSSSNKRRGGGRGVFHPQLERRRSLGEICHAIEPPQADASQRNQGYRNHTLPSASTATDVEHVLKLVVSLEQLGGQVNRHSSVPCRAPREAETGPAPGGTAAKGSAGGAGMLPEPAAVLNVWRRTKEEEEKLFRILNGPIPPPPPPSASTFSWPPTEEEEAEIQRVLRGRGSGRRLQAFQNFCPED